MGSSNKQAGRQAVSGSMAKKNEHGDPLVNFPIVGIGASAGGLEALKLFFSAMPANTGMSFVVLQHLDPHHESMTTQILARCTTMSVQEVQTTTVIEANHVYVLPPNKDLTILHGKLSLVEPTVSHGLRTPIDYFLRALAEDKKDAASCIILSGTGSDGALGVKAIKYNGGLVIVQSPETANFGGMPRSAIETGVVDFIAAVDEMPQILSRYLGCLSDTVDIEEPTLVNADDIELILSALHMYTKYSFQQYKKGTLKRRIERRMGIKHIDSAADYARLVQENEAEARALCKDLLISVTDFFRDTDFYNMLEKEAICRIVQQKAPGEAIRVWVPACATGEEAYSIGMLFIEQLEQANKRCPLHIFATDIDDAALDVARAGLYPSNIEADIKKTRLEHFFAKEGTKLKVRKVLRESVVFAVQNLISDPPFSRLDLISCRNLLIYLESDLQRKIIALFHFSLSENGYLFLGSSETIGSQEDLFRPIEKKARLYQRIGTTRRNEFDWDFVPGLGKLAKHGNHSLSKVVEPISLGKLTQKVLLDRYSPFAVLVNQRYEILYLHGQSGPYLEQTTGEPSLNLLEIAREGLRSQLRGILQKTFEQHQEFIIRVRVKRAGEYCPVVLGVIPVSLPKITDGLAVVTFAEGVDAATANNESADTVEPSDEALVDQLEAELKETKDCLRRSVEDLEASNEELRSSNEEIMSGNEELQSTNEELEASKEELQSLNEELSTLNTQLQDKVEELASTNDDLSNLLSNTDIAALFLDSGLRIGRFTPATCHLFSLIFSDMGRYIGDISNRFVDLKLVEEAKQVLDSLVPVEKNVSTDTGEHFILRIRPFHTEEQQVEGVVVTFIDITCLKLAEESLTLTRERVDLLLRSTGESVYGVDRQGQCTFVNKRLLQQLGFTAQEVIGSNIHNLYHHTRSDGSVYPWTECFVYRCLQDGVSYRSGHGIAWRKNGSSFPTQYSVEPITKNGGVEGAIVVFRDLSESGVAGSTINHLARHDALTGLINRREFEQCLAVSISHAQQHQLEHVVCDIDLDQFKVINDTCGHLAGDEMLRQVANLLEGCVRPRDTLARLGGDEFGLLIEDCDLKEGLLVANSIRDAIAAYRFMWEGKPHLVGVSIGVVLVNTGTANTTEVLKAADSACYMAKEGGRNRIHIYSERDKAFTHRHGEMTWVAGINRALEEGRMLLALQPIVPITDSVADSCNIEKRAYEVLVRIRDQNGAIILPEDFLRAAEQYNLATKLDRWVANAMFTWIAENKQVLEQTALFNINVSGQSLGDEEFLDFIVELLRKNDVPAGKICFEITESAAITHLARAQKFIEVLKGMGCKFALDDFGTGLSSFAYLKNLPVEFLKISGMFVKDITSNSIDFAMVKSINEIGQAMGAKTIAESVESEAIFEVLKGLGVNLAQGFAVGKPIMLDEVEFENCIDEK